MEFAIVGLPFVGKTTLFNALTGAQSDTDARRGHNLATVAVDDARLHRLAAAFNPPKITRVSITYVELAGISEGAFARGAMTREFLAAIRNADALVHVVRAFDSDSTPHVYDTLDPSRDAETLEVEFALADLQIIENRLERLERETRIKKDSDLNKERDTLLRFQAALEAGTPLREIEIQAEEERLTRGYQFLTAKPLALVLNIGEDQIGDEAASESLKKWTDKRNTGVSVVCAKIEAELAQLSDEDAAAFREDMGLPDDGALSLMVKASYDVLGIRTFLTVGEREARAWTLPNGGTALDAAGAIHSDMARGFIRAETCRWDELADAGSYGKLREAGKLRLEGKEYVVQEGDVLLIRFNV